MSDDLPIAEIVALAAVDGEFFSHAFFPRMARQKSPPFHKPMDQLLDSHKRLINIQVFRGGAKTSKLRAYTAKRIAYGLSRTILYIGKSESHAVRSVRWLKKQIEANARFRDTFQLSPGAKWQDTEAEVKHGIEKHTVWIMASGITGALRGINQDDFRPDLIILDDVIDDENAGTFEQREKIKVRINGAVKESLAPASESPDAKLVMLQTPIHQEDASCEALNDPEWASAVFGCFTPETKDLPTHMQQSAWPERWTDEVLREEKMHAVARNQSSVWYREKECKLISPETTAFVDSWLKFYDPIQLPDTGQRVLVIDPVPPPSPRELEQGLEKKDFECHHVVQRSGNEYYSVAYEQKKGHDPSWSVATMFSLAEKYNVQKIMVESVAYQRTLAWLMRRAMEERKRWWQVVEFTDQRSKFSKIVDSLNGIASAGHVHVLADQTELIGQFNDYPRVSHDDALETLALGCMDLSGPGHYEVDLEHTEEEEDLRLMYGGDTDLDMNAILGAP